VELEGRIFDDDLPTSPNFWYSMLADVNFGFLLSNDWNIKDSSVELVDILSTKSQNFKSDLNFIYPNIWLFDLELNLAVVDHFQLFVVVDNFEDQFEYH
jgi:hypothetical protein